MSRRKNFTPTQLALTYSAAGSAWILITDWVVAIHSGASATAFTLEAGKGLLFIAVTAVLLFWWARQWHGVTVTEAEALAQARDRSERARRMYATLSAVNRQIIHPVDRQSLCQSLCDSLINPGEFCLAWIAQIAPPDRTVRTIALAGASRPPEFILSEAGVADDLATAIAVATRTRHPTVAPLLNRKPGALTAFARACTAASCAAVPFDPESAEPKILVVCSRIPDYFGPDTMAMLAELVADLEHGIEVLDERARRTAAESALRASDERYRLVTANTHDVIWLLSREIKLQYVSPSVEKLLGYTTNRTMEITLARLIAPRSFRHARFALARSIAELKRYGRIRSRLIELELTRADGSTVWTEIQTTDCRNDDGQSIGILGVTRDITARRAAEKALAAEVARCRALLDVSVDGIQVTDLNGRLLDANEIFLRERGFTRDMIPNLSISDWNAEWPRDAIITRSANFTAEPSLFETVHRRRDGTLFPVEIRAKRVELEGRVVIYATTRDTTERKGMEQRLLRAQRLESVGLIASGIAHDLNNVLTPILLSTGLLEMRYNAPEDHALLDPIESAARRGSNIVQQILTFARGAEGQRVTVAPKILLKELSHLVRETFPRNIVHRLQIADDAHSLIGDPTQLHQVFLNLAVNARDAMPRGGTLTIDVQNRQLDEDDIRLMPSAHPGNYVAVTVADSGTGMTPETLDHLFEPFFTTKPRGRGTGLGLSTVHGLVRSHGGFVEVNSILGHGSEFRVFLPAAPAGCPTMEAKPVAPPAKIGHGEHILVADDEPAILTVAQSVLRRNGFAPLTASDGDEALTLLNTFHQSIALVITDVMMPKFDGVRLAAEVRERFPSIPIIAMSGLIAPTPDEDSRQQLRQIGVATILDKPYGEAELVRAITTTLDAVRSGAVRAR